MARQTVALVPEANDFAHPQAVRPPGEWHTRVGPVQHGNQLRHGIAVLQGDERLGGVVGNRRPGIDQSIEKKRSIFLARARPQGLNGGLPYVGGKVEKSTLAQGHARPRAVNLRQ